MTDFLPSEVASVFEYQSRINFGAFGSVYKVKKRSIIYLGNQKFYAMKIISIDPNNRANLNDTEVELRILSELFNPYLIHLDSYFKVENEVFIAMEYCENCDLLKEINDKECEKQDFEEDEIWKYFIQISFGIEALHNSGFIHRDIKPQNILLDRNRDLKITDFGLSRFLEASSVRETPAYYSPRTRDGEVPTQESDIWALGCVLYYLCNLEEFNEKNKKIKNEPDALIKRQYSQDLMHFVNWCLQRERNERPTVNDIITHQVIVNKAISLGIAIPTTSAMSAIYWSLLNSEEAGKKMLDYSEHTLNKTINENLLLIPQDLAIDDDICLNELSYFRSCSKDFVSINLNTFQISSTITLPIQEPIYSLATSCILPDKTYFYCCNEYSSSGYTFTIDKDKNVKQLQNSKVNYWADPIFYNNFIYLIGGREKLAERYDFKRNIWESMTPIAHNLDFSLSCNVLFKDLILITSYYMQKIVIYSITQNNYQEVQNLLLKAEINKLMLQGNNRIYVFEKSGRTFESAENNISSWTQIANNTITNEINQSSVVLYKGGFYFVVQENNLWKFDLSSKQASYVAEI